MSTTCNSTTSGGKVIYDLTSETREDIESHIDGLLRRYHPMGYGTSFSTPRQNSDGLWIATGSRSSSCD